LTWYLVDNIEYLLTVKRNVREAEQAAELFMAENRNDFAAYEKVGDYFYGFGGEMGTDLGLRMWETSLTSSGTERRRVLSKLAKHYLDEGRSEFDNAFNPTAPKDALQRAKVHFLRALEYDRSSEEAAGLVREVDTEIEAKEQRQLFMIDLVSGGQEMMRLAEGNVTKSLFEAALPQFEKAIHTFRQVDDEFEEQQEAAREGAERCQVQIARLITSVLEEGRSVLNQGDDLFDQKKFDEAISTYERVPAQVDFLNRVDLVPSQKGELDDLLAQAEDSVIKADQEKRRAEAAAANPQPAGLPGATPAPALPGRGGGILPGAGARGGRGGQ
jgi:tetratricopeptide (TPR) repeat protein